MLFRSDRTLFIREKGAWDNNEEGGRKRAAAVKRNGIGPEAVLWIDWMEIERVSDATTIAPGLEALGIPLDDAGTVTTAEMKPALSMPWAMRPENAVLLANSSLMCTGLLSPEIPANRTISVSVKVRA